MSPKLVRLLHLHVLERLARGLREPYTLNPQPSALNPQPATLNP